MGGEKKREVFRGVGHFVAVFVDDASGPLFDHFRKRFGAGLVAKGLMPFGQGLGRFVPEHEFDGRIRLAGHGELDAGAKGRVGNDSYCHQ